jgi:hypothetical protein
MSYQKNLRYALMSGKASDMFIVIPVTIAAAFSNSGTQVAPLPGSSALCSLKSNFLNLFDQADISVQGKPLVSVRTNKRHYHHNLLKLISIFVSTSN